MSGIGLDLSGLAGETKEEVEEEVENNESDEDLEEEEVEPEDDTEDYTEEVETVDESINEIQEPIQNQSSNVVLTDAFSFLKKFKDKIENCIGAELSFPSVPDGKYILFLTNEEEDANMYLVESPAKLHFEDFEPDKILVEHSGVIATSNRFRTYIGKTNVIQFTIENGIPIKMSVIKKSTNSVDARVNVVEKEENDMSVEELKLHIRKVSPRLEKLTSDLTDKDDIKNAIISFLDDVRDINHLIKINAEIMMIAF